MLIGGISTVADDADFLGALVEDVEPRLFLGPERLFQDGDGLGVLRAPVALRALGQALLRVVRQAAYEDVRHGSLLPSGVISA